MAAQLTQAEENMAALLLSLSTTAALAASAAAASLEHQAPSPGLLEEEVAAVVQAVWAKLQAEGRVPSPAAATEAEVRGGRLVIKGASHIHARAPIHNPSTHLCMTHRATSSSPKSPSPSSARRSRAS